MYCSQDLLQLADEYIEEAEKVFENKEVIRAIVLVQNALQFYKEAGETKKYAFHLNTLGVFYGTAGNDSMATDSYLEGLELCEQNHYEEYISLFYNNLGSSFQNLKEYEKAIYYYLKAEEYLANPKAMQEERYGLRLLVAYANLSDSYRAIENYGKAREYMRKTEPLSDDPLADAYRASLLISKCLLECCAGDKEFVCRHLDEIVEGILANVNTSDYVQDITSACELMQKMDEVGRWRKILEAADIYMDSRHSVLFRLLMVELWMDFYSYTSDEAAYEKACVEHAKLYKLQRVEENKSRASAVEMKIELREKEKARQLAEENSNTDPLTKVYNRKKLRADIEEMLCRCSGKHTEIGVGILDVDCFKELNDTYGHLKGDEILVRVAEVIQDAVKERGKIYRYGGDEFVILAFDSGKSVLQGIGDAIKSGVAALGIPNEKSKVEPFLTVSQGYACLTPKEEESSSQILEYADKALYYIKEHGRNDIRIVSE